MGGGGGVNGGNYRDEGQVIRQKTKIHLERKHEMWVDISTFNWPNLGGAGEEKLREKEETVQEENRPQDSPPPSLPSTPTSLAPTTIWHLHMEGDREEERWKGLVIHLGQENRNKTRRLLPALQTICSLTSGWGVRRPNRYHPKY